jgi:SpoVK/Ycf46/Vps4 family AAA+-type ATPase
MRTCLKVASFQKKIYVPLPDDPSRARLFLKLAGKGTELTPAEAEELAERTRMFSVQDIANAVNDGTPAKSPAQQRGRAQWSQ